ncbi:hypothetical protein NUW54_g7701 [Trametes sanguinea]|uniref:Uncharacterized protein n=1 Tax=Trametes sanguinea TaxID=158606 RepID=A0ACC1PIP6_9APHY|nr:hypothetical protein NUW54_g7701 [Trametes sanguinea]
MRSLGSLLGSSPERTCAMGIDFKTDAPMIRGSVKGGGCPARGRDETKSKLERALPAPTSTARHEDDSTDTHVLYILFLRLLDAAYGLPILGLWIPPSSPGRAPRFPLEEGGLVHLLEQGHRWLLPPGIPHLHILMTRVRLLLQPKPAIHLRMKRDVLLHRNAHEAGGAQPQEYVPHQPYAVREGRADFVPQRLLQARDERDTTAVRHVLVWGEAREELGGLEGVQAVLEDHMAPEMDEAQAEEKVRMKRRKLSAAAFCVGGRGASTEKVVA